MPSITDTLPSFEAVCQLTSLPNLSDYDTDENLHIRITSQYATVQEVASMELSDKDFSLFHMNIRSHSLHHDELHALLSSLNIYFQVIGLPEIKFSTETQVKTNIELPGYNFHYTPSQGSAGGVGLYVKSELKASQRNDLCISNVDFETVWIEIINPKAKNLLCCCTYRHPNSEISTLIDNFHEVIGNLAKENKQIAIMDDFTIDLLNYDSHIATNEFVNMMFSHHFQPCSLHPSRITDTSSTIIDNIYINSAYENNVVGGNILSLISDHLPQFAILFGNTPEYKVSFASVHDYRNFNEENFLAEYTAIEKSYITDDDINVSKKFDTFLLKLHNLVDKHCPKKKLSKKALKLRNRPLINLQIQKMIKIRNNLFHQFKLAKSVTDLQAYKQFRNRVVNQIRESKRNSYHQYFDEYRSNMKMLWKGIKGILRINQEILKPFHT